MIFYNLGDGYSSGCCTANLHHFANQDKQYFSMIKREHPANRLGSFINQLADIYKASCITESYHRCTIQEMYDNFDYYKDDIKKRVDEVIAFIGVPDLRSVYFNDDLEIRTLFGITDDVNFLVDRYLFLDGKDELTMSKEQENTYIKLCEMRDRIKPNIEELESFIKKISTITKNVIIYRTTQTESLNLNLPDNATLLDMSIVEVLSQKHKPYRKGYFDKQAYKTLVNDFLKVL